MKLLMTAAILVPLALSELANGGRVEGAQDGKVELKWKFEKGRELAYKQTQKQSMEFAGTAMEQESSQTQIWTVKDVAEDGTATIETKCVAVSSKASGAMEFEYDSEKDKEVPENPQVKMMAKMVGKAFTLKMTPSGKIVEMKGFDALMEEMLKDLGEDVGPMKEMLKQMLSDDTMKSAMQQLAPMLPEKAVGKGDAWKNDFTLKFPMIGGMKFGVASTMTDLKDGDAHIGQTWTIELKGDDADKDNPLGGLVKITDSKGKSQIVFSATRGCFVSQKMTMELTMDAGGQQIPVKTESEMKLVEKPRKNF